MTHINIVARVHPHYEGKPFSWCPRRHPHRLVGVVGFLGAYTTFSGLARGSVQLFDSGRLLSGVLYPLASVAIGLISVSAGDRAGALLLRRRRRQPARDAQPSASIDDHDELKVPALPLSPRS